MHGGWRPRNRDAPIMNIGTPANNKMAMCIVSRRRLKNRSASVAG
jgi:hypothetical protein